MSNDDTKFSTHAQKLVAVRGGARKNMKHVQKVDGGTSSNLEGKFNGRVLGEEIIEGINGAPPPEPQDIINVAIHVKNVLDEGAVGVEHVAFKEAEENFTDGGY